jgi:osmotically-inducible protein OsmY
MKKVIAAMALSVLMVGAIGCSNWNRMTPKPLDNTAIEEEIRKNMLRDGITGMHVGVDNGVVTLEGDAKSNAQRDQAIQDARKVQGVTTVVNRISIKP